MTQTRFMNNGTVLKTDELTTAVVGMKHYSHNMKIRKGDHVQVKQVQVEGFRNVLGVFLHGVQIGNIIARLTQSDLSSRTRVFTNTQIIKELKDLHFKVQHIGRNRIVLKANYR